MKKLFILSAFFVVTKILLASPQSPDLLIMGKDTINLYALPLQQLDEKRGFKFGELVEKETEGISFNLWRGYRGVWKIIDDKLYLVNLERVNNTPYILEEVFGNDFKDGKVFADWASFTVIIPKGKQLKWDGIFASTYEKENHIIIHDGKVIETTSVNNYIKVKGGISRKKDNKEILKIIFNKIKKLDWETLSDCGCDDEYLITIDANGRISKVDIKEDDKDEDELKCINLIYQQINNLKFDVIRWNGHPYEETLLLWLFYDDKKNNLENLSD